MKSEYRLMGKTKKDKKLSENKKGSGAPGFAKNWKWLIVAAAAAAAAVCIIVCVMLPMTKEPEPVATPAPTKSAAPTASASPDATPTPGKTILPELKELYEKNSDLAGWIKIDGTKVDYPVMYTPQDGEFYLYRTFEKQDDPTKEGCLFIDKNCTIDPRSTNLLIHGHNMKNGTMFHTLLEYEKEEFYKEHPVISYSSLYSADEYEIAAVFLSKIYNKDEDVFKFYKFYDAKTADEFDAFVENIKEMELYETGVTPEFGDELITLSTCEYSQDNGRIVVVARKVTDVSTVSGEVVL